MTKIIQKEFKDLRKGDRILVEVVVDCRNDNSAYVMLEGGEYDVDSMTIGPDKYHGCLAPEPKVLKVGMKFRHHGYNQLNKIYDISEGRVYYFITTAPSFTFDTDAEKLAINQTIGWLEE